MNELEELRAEVAQLREATKLLFALTTSVLAGSADSAQALANLMANIAEVNRVRDRGAAFDEMAAAALLALSSIALKQHPSDMQVRETYRGLRPGERH